MATEQLVGAKHRHSNDGNMSIVRLKKNYLWQIASLGIEVDIDKAVAATTFLLAETGEMIAFN